MLMVGLGDPQRRYCHPTVPGHWAFIYHIRLF
jgi:hypothetical protein